MLQVSESFLRTCVEEIAKRDASEAIEQGVTLVETGSREEIMSSLWDDGFWATVYSDDDPDAKDMPLIIQAQTFAKISEWYAAAYLDEFCLAVGMTF